MVERTNEGTKRHFGQMKQWTKVKRIQVERVDEHAIGQANIEHVIGQENIEHVIKQENIETGEMMGELTVKKR